MKDPAYEDKLVDWILSEYSDEGQLLQLTDLQHRIAEVEGKVLKNEENLFLVKSSLQLYRNLLKLNTQEEQKLAVIMLYFVETAQKQHIRKIPNPLAVAQSILLLSRGKITVVNTLYVALLESDRLIDANYLEEMTRWLASERQDERQLLIGDRLQQAFRNIKGILTDVENDFLVRSAVYNLRRRI